MYLNEEVQVIHFPSREITASEDLAHITSSPIDHDNADHAGRGACGF